MTVSAPTLRLALDQNFPTPLMRALADYLPGELELESLRRIDARLSELDDRTLFLALHHLGWQGLVTNNYKMLDVPAELAAIVRTQAVVVAVEGLGHDPLRAVGALLLELPGLPSRVRPRRSNVFRLAYRRRPPEDGRKYFEQVLPSARAVTRNISGKRFLSATRNSSRLGSSETKGPTQNTMLRPSRRGHRNSCTRRTEYSNGTSRLQNSPQRVSKAVEIPGRPIAVPPAG